MEDVVRLLLGDELTHRRGIQDVRPGRPQPRILPGHLTIRVNDAANVEVGVGEEKADQVLSNETTGSGNESLQQRTSARC
jgi:hypothetical protein